MKIIHSADWHIGQQFFGFDRQEEHLFFFDWLKKTIRDLKADVLLVAGDIFDSPNPSAESQKIYYRFLREVTTENPHLQIIIIAGNHDSAARLEAPKPLLEDMNIHISGLIPRTTTGKIDFQRLFVPLYKNEEIAAWCIPVPYLRQGDYTDRGNYGQGVMAFYDSLHQEIQKHKTPHQPIIFMGHLQATGSEVSEDDRSERTIIGGLEAISPEMFDKKDVVYTALGHLHKSQRVSGKEHIRYAGSPLPMSFSEKHYKQGVNLIELSGESLLKIERIPFEPLTQLLSIPKDPQPLNDVLEEIASLEDGPITSHSPYLEVKVLLTEPEPSLYYQIEEALKGKSVRLATATRHWVKKERNAREITYEELKALSPQEMAQDVFFNIYGSEMPDKLKTLFSSIMQEVKP